MKKSPCTSRSPEPAAPISVSRRALLQGASASAFLGVLPGAHSLTAALPRPADKSKTFPDKFLWGAATAGAQVEGNNTTSDLWALEHLPHSMYKDLSGDACDHYHLYPQDIALLADLGFNTYRFSIE